jgi:hypothetical protein
VAAALYLGFYSRAIDAGYDAVRADLLASQFVLKQGTLDELTAANPLEAFGGAEEMLKDLEHKVFAS